MPFGSKRSGAPGVVDLVEAFQHLSWSGDRATDYDLEPSVVLERQDQNLP
jgi:hypothetical protein